MPGTGFGRLIGKDPGKAFWGIDEDANAFARFIVRFITKYNRWNSPKFLFGESYGTTRSAVLADILQNNMSVDLNGVILLSQIFNFTTDIDEPAANPGVDLPYVLALPTYAATAWYHKKRPNPQPAALEPFLKEVEDYAMGPYSHALALGTDLSDAEKQAVAEKLHDYSGLPVAYCSRPTCASQAASSPKPFRTTRTSPPAASIRASPAPPSIHSARARITIRSPPPSPRPTSRSSTTTSAASSNTAKARPTCPEPSSAARIGTRSTMATPPAPMSQTTSPKPSRPIPASRSWSTAATTISPRPFFAAQYEEKHLPIPQSLAKNIEYDWYESGHMVYVRDESLKQLHDRVAAFIKSTLADNK